MLAKLLIGSPIAAVFGYISGFISQIDGRAIENATIDFVVLGKIPATESYLSFEIYLGLAIALLMVPNTIRLVKKARRVIKTEVDFIGSIEAIAL